MLSGRSNSDSHTVRRHVDNEWIRLYCLSGIVITVRRHVKRFDVHSSSRVPVAFQEAHLDKCTDKLHVNDVFLVELQHVTCRRKLLEFDVSR